MADERARPVHPYFVTPYVRRADCTLPCCARTKRERLEVTEAVEGSTREDRMVTIRRGPDGVPTVWCDPEIADLVSALNHGGVPAAASCSGHGERHGNICLRDGRVLVILPSLDDLETAIALPAERDDTPSHDPLTCPPGGGCPGCSNWPEHCVCERDNTPAQTDPKEVGRG